VKNHEELDKIKTLHIADMQNYIEKLTAAHEQELATVENLYNERIDDLKKSLADMTSQADEAVALAEKYKKMLDERPNNIEVQEQINIKQGQIEQLNIAEQLNSPRVPIEKPVKPAPKSTNASKLRAQVTALKKKSNA